MTRDTNKQKIEQKKKKQMNYENTLKGSVKIKKTKAEANIMKNREKNFKKKKKKTASPLLLFGNPLNRGSETNKDNRSSL